MAENQFIVDLGTIKLTDDQTLRINSAIQKAVAGELATFNVTKKIALFPISKFPKGPILNGIILRDLGNRFDELIK
jgi:hypothetical protein